MNFPALPSARLTPALEDALLMPPDLAFGEVYAFAAGYRALAREALGSLHAQRARVAALESQLSDLRAELRSMRRSTAA